MPNMVTGQGISSLQFCPSRTMSTCPEKVSNEPRCHLQQCGIRTYPLSCDMITFSCLSLQCLKAPSIAMYRSLPFAACECLFLLHINLFDYNQTAYRLGDFLTCGKGSFRASLDSGWKVPQISLCCVNKSPLVAYKSSLLQWLGIFFLCGQGQLCELQLGLFQSILWQRI